jgi:putative alpha-1,2-mannosidase
MVEGGTKDQRVIFHTAHYHALFHPQLASDVNGEYRGLDGNVHKTDGHQHYSVLSTWDTFRAAHPLYTIVEPELQLDVIKTMIDDYKDSGGGLAGNWPTRRSSGWTVRLGRDGSHRTLHGREG